MNMKKILPILAMMAMSEPMGGKNYYDDSEYTPLTDEQKERLRVERLKAKGLKEFWIKGVCIVALNEKNAIKKYNKLNK
jgi:hypothetical protein